MITRLLVLRLLPSCFKVAGVGEGSLALWSQAVNMAVPDEGAVLQRDGLGHAECANRSIAFRPASQHRPKADLAPWMDLLAFSHEAVLLWLANLQRRERRGFKSLPLRHFTPAIHL